MGAEQKPPRPIGGHLGNTSQGGNEAHENMEEHQKLALEEAHKRGEQEREEKRKDGLMNFEHMNTKK